MHGEFRARAWAFTCVMLVAVVTVAGCAQAAAPTVDQPAPGASLTGSVTFAEEPVPGAHIQLRTADWRSNPDPVVAETVSDNAGMFVFEQPPAGEYVVIGAFPDGEEDEGGWPVVNVEPERAISEFVVPLERHLTLLEPESGAVVSEKPILTWQAFPRAAEYRVWLIDAGTTEVLMDERTTEPLLAVLPTLTLGQTYRWVVNALSPDDCVMASGTREFRFSD